MIVLYGQVLLLLRIAIAGVFLFNAICAVPPYCIPARDPPESYIDWSRLAAKTKRELDSFKNQNFIENETHPIVQTNSGLVQGYSMGTMKGRRIFAFQGIYYAESTADDNRFKSPIPKPPWKGIKKAFSTGPPCLQTHPVALFRVIGDEDCLTVNIYTPEISKNSTDLLPVLFYIHGGCFIFGSNSEIGPAYLLDHNVIMVSINYRLGVLGFMSTGDMASPGNYGLKDQALAMKWVHENIANFGGDPEQITIMGQSAGGVSVHLHMLANKTRQYFKRGVSISGTAHLHWGIRSPEKGRKFTTRLAKFVNCYSDDNYQMTDCLRKNTSPSLIVALTLQLFNWSPFPPVLFAPVIEPDGDEAFITESPDEIYAQNKVAPYPWISTLTTQEGYIAINFQKVFLRWTQFRLRMVEYLPIALDFKGNPKSRVLSEKIYKFYSNGERNPMKIPANTVSNMIMDRYFSYGVIKSLKAHSQIVPETYSYLFGFSGKYNQATLFGIPNIGDQWGVGHCEDIFYFFNSSYFSDGYKQTDPEYKLSQIMTNLLVNFMTKGTPHYTDLVRGDLTIWDPIQNNTRDDYNNIKFLQLNSDIKMIENPLIERVKFWESLKIEDVQPLKFSYSNPNTERNFEGNFKDISSNQSYIPRK